jgi:large subunit ribosomal protein L5
MSDENNTENSTQETAEMAEDSEDTDNNNKRTSKNSTEDPNETSNDSTGDVTVTDDNPEQPKPTEQTSTADDVAQSTTQTTPSTIPSTTTPITSTPITEPAVEAMERKSEPELEVKEKTEVNISALTSSFTKESTEPTQPTTKPLDESKTTLRDISIDKVVINIGVGEAGDKLIKAEKVIELLTHRKSIQTLSNTTNRDFGIRKKMPIGCKVTLRRKEAEEFLNEAFWVKDNRITGYSFDQNGNFSFGIPDYTEFRNMKYDPEIGIFGMDISVTMKRLGFRISKRKLNRRKIPNRNRIKPEEVKAYVKSRFNVEVIE